MLLRFLLALVVFLGAVSAFIGVNPSGRSLKNIMAGKLRSHCSKLGPKMQVKGENCYSGMADLVADDYLAFGLAQCYKLVDTKATPTWLIEPLTGATLECITNGLPTSYKRTVALKASEAFLGPVSSPTGINLDALQPLLSGGEEATLCDDAIERTLAAGRTLRRRVECQMVPIGQTCEKYNFQPNVNKRVVNMKTLVRDEDNVKQDMSIDAYGRSK